ncbi:MAG: PAS-domain containing protein [Holosporaceae bacterium]|jgi:signal transduction histidine kinase|nr:PAS-domain containing protein [Holosporaceae bacterium]
MKTWSKTDLIGLFLVMFGIICLVFSNSTLLTTATLLLASIALLHSIYDARYELIKYRDILCHYQAALSSASNGWIAWNKHDEYIGSSKKFRTFLGINHSSNIFISDILAAIDAKDAEDLSFHFNRLKKVGASFKITVKTLANDNKIEVSGSRLMINGIETVLLWCSNITSSSCQVASLEQKLSDAMAKINWLSEILDALPIFVWRRNKKLGIMYCNKIYADALDTNVEKILLDNIPLVPGNLFGQGHSLAENAKKCNRSQSIAQFVIINGIRKKLSIHECVASNENLIGFAVDVTAEENLAANLDRVMTANCEVLESLSTAIAIFNENARLIFFNSAYQRLMKLEAGWLHAKPTYAEILDESRNNRQLPEHADFQAFKKSQLALFTSITSSVQEMMHLPNGKTLRLIIAPYPMGGLSFMYEDVTDSLTLQRKNNTLLAVQKETLDNLYEGITVYGSDNRLKIVNNAMLKIWKLDKNRPLVEWRSTHLSEMLEALKDSLNYGTDWHVFLEDAISNLTDRIAKTGKLLKNDNSVILFSYIPLPDGAHMHSFIDITDTCVVENAIMEKNQALKAAQKLRFEFVSGISTELKEPLNVLIGFAELLMHQYFGALNEKQTEYCRCILDASNQLHQLINNLLEMVSIDIDSTNLELSVFPLEDALDEAILSLEKRAKGKNIDVVRNYSADGPLFSGDKTRIKQALFNILINAIQFTPPNGKIEAIVTSDDSHMKIIIKDQSIGRSKIEKKKVFKRTANRISFLGADSNSISMPLVRTLIELHGGTLSISSEVEGTSVICSLPIKKAEVIDAKPIETPEDSPELPKVVNS